MTEMRKEFEMERDGLAELLRDIADALENESQLNMEFGDQKLIQPLGPKTPLRIYQDDNGTEIGFRLMTDDQS